MKLAEWLEGDHEPSQRLKAVQSLCRAVTDREGGASLSLDPARIEVTVGGECRPEEGKGVPSGRYRAPESADGRPPTPQAQVYTVGVLCFEILGGRAFEARGGPLLRDVRPDLPRDLCDAVQACLEMDADWRPKDLSYVLGLVDGMGPASASPPRASGRGGRAAVVPAVPTNAARRSAPAPRPWPLLAFALVALAASLATAFFRLRQPIDPPALPPAAGPVASPSAREGDPAGTTAAPGTKAAGTTPVPSASSAPSLSGASSPSAGRSPSPPGTTVASKRTASAPAAVPTPVVTTAPVPVAPTTPAPTAAPTAAPVTEPAGPAAVTSVAPPMLRRGATVLVDVHGVNLRSEHQVRIVRAKETAARGIEVMRQRYVGPTLLQVLLRVDASAPPGAYLLYLVDGAGATNARPLEVGK